MASGWRIEYRRGIYLPQVDLWLDPPFPTARAFVSHAHFDHMALHQQIIFSTGTARLMRARLPAEREERVLEFGQQIDWDSETRLRLHPAGHILGSAQLELERQSERLLYTGDFKLRHGSSAEPCATPRAEVLIMETTYGLPRYQFPPAERVLEQIVHFCREAIDAGEVPVLLGYSLGKSQELLASLAHAALPVMLHSQTLKMTQVYESLGVAFPPYKAFALAEVAGHVVICPPQSNGSGWLRKIKGARTAAITGWAMNPNAVYRYQCHAAFPLSDHADYNELLAFVEGAQPQCVYTVHGYAGEFAQTLRERGIEAWALGSDNQLELGISRALPTPVHLPLEPAPGQTAAPASRVESGSPAESFLALALLAEQVRSHSGTREKVACLAAYLKGLPEESLALAVTYLAGRVFPAASGLVLQVGWSFLRRALLKVAGLSEAEWHSAYHRLGDSGETALAILGGDRPSSLWTLKEVHAALEQIANSRRPEERLGGLCRLLEQLSGVEAKYLIKIVTGDLRIGMKEGLIEEGVAVALDCPSAAVREARLMGGDLAQAVHQLLNHGSGVVGLTYFQPVPPMLASPEPDAESVVRRLGGRVWAEQKWDGIRCQLHKCGERVELFSRDLKCITPQFLDLVHAVQKVRHDFILDGELLAWRDGRALPFAHLQRRLGKANDDLFFGPVVPVAYCAYDLLQLDGRGLVKEPLRQRRAALESLPTISDRLLFPPVLWTEGVSAIDSAFEQARAAGNEGLMLKDPESLYTPGRRGLAWLKLKKAHATLDVVVVAVEYGHGKRRDVLSDYTFAVRDETSGALRTIGKAYTGLTDAEIATMTDHFLSRTLETKGKLRRVLPDTVIEVAFDAVQPSTRHDSGLALRFPRIVRLRPDKTADEIDTLERARELVSAT